MRQHGDGYTGRGSTFDMKDGWSTSGNLITAGSGQPVTLQAAFPAADVYTVQFAVTPPESGVFRAIAKITWTVEGNQISREVDIGNGVSISAPSQSVRVAVTDATSLALSGASGQKYAITISVTRGVRPASDRPPTLAGEGVIPPGTNISIAPINLLAGQTAKYLVPVSAGVVSVAVSAATLVAGVDADVLISQGNPTTNTKLYKYSDQGAGDAFVSIAPFATQVLVTNVDPTNACIISLTWGIDG
jgi:hypothetical protein